MRNVNKQQIDWQSYIVACVLILLAVVLFLTFDFSDFWKLSNPIDRTGRRVQPGDLLEWTDKTYTTDASEAPVQMMLVTHVSDDGMRGIYRLCVLVCWWPESDQQIWWMTNFKFRLDVLIRDRGCSVTGGQIRCAGSTSFVSAARRLL